MTAAAPAGWDGTVGDRFREQAARTPDALAVVDGPHRLRYADVLTRAQALSVGLRRLGVVPGTFVGVALDRSADAVAGLLGVLFAGGAYVPLDPQWPAHRVRQVLAAGGPRLTLHDPARHPGLAGRWPSAAGLRDLRDVADGGGAAVADLPGPAEPAAYVLFTSGSTGRPKGVVVEHRGVLRLVTGTDYVDFDRPHRFLHGAALGFDAATFEIWGALLNGGTLCVADRDTMLVPARYGRALRTHRITAAWLTAPLFHLVAAEDPGLLAPLRVLVTGGDVVAPAAARAVLARLPDLRLLNGYGPTENTTFTTAHHVTAAGPDPLPIGRPIPGSAVLVVDDRGAPVPDGTVGELYAGGAGLARGYLGEPELTGERFVELGGRRWFRTGDLARRDGSGLLHFHGRIDDQVKIAGQLVAPAEVDAALLAVPGVRAAHTVAAARSGGDLRLAAYVVADVPDDVIRTALTAVLPAYLRPDVLVRLDRLPLAATGKVDRALLPPPFAGPAAAGAGAAGLLAGLWAEVLELPVTALGPESDFVELGGDSVRLGRLLGRIEAATGARLPIDVAFEARTLGAMAAAAARAPGGPGPIPRRPAGAGADRPPHQRGVYASWQADPDAGTYNSPVRVRLRGPLNLDRLRSALGVLVKRHDALRMRFSVTGGTVTQRAAAVAGPAVPVLAEPPTAQPFAPDRPPLLRAALVPTGPDRHELHLDTAHAVVDGVSLRILVDELLQLHAGRRPPLPAVHYAEAAQWAHDRLRSAADTDWWRRELAGAPTDDLPTDHARGRGRAVRGAVVRRVLTGPGRQAVLGTARRHRTTLFAVLLAGWAATLSRLGGRRDLVVGTPAAGRTHPDLERVVGMFAGTLCLRLRFGPDARLGDLVGIADRTARAALAHQDQPFDRLVDLLVPHRQAARAPLFDAFLALHNLGFEQLGAGGLAASMELLNPGTTRFDLNLQAYQRPDGLVLDLEYAAELFEPASARHILDTVVGVLADLDSAPERRVWERAAEPLPTGPDFDLGGR